MKKNVEGKRGIPKKRWLDGIEKYMKKAGVNKGEMGDRALWRCRLMVTNSI